MLFDLVQPFLRAEVSLEFAEISLRHATVSITIQTLGLGLFTASSPIVPSLHRLKISILKLLNL